MNVSPHSGEADGKSRWFIRLQLPDGTLARLISSGAMVPGVVAHVSNADGTEYVLVTRQSYVAILVNALPDLAASTDLAPSLYSMDLVRGSYDADANHYDVESHQFLYGEYVNPPRPTPTLPSLVPVSVPTTVRRRYDFRKLLDPTPAQSPLPPVSTVPPPQ